MLKYILGGVVAIVIATLLGSSFNSARSAEYNPPQAALLLDKSVVQLKKGSKTICTATKIGAKRYLTARHCVQGSDTNFSVVPRDVDNPTAVIGIYIPTSKKVLSYNKNAQDDWAVLFTDREFDTVNSLPIACNEDIYLGKTVAYMGFGIPLQQGFFTGYVSSLDSSTNMLTGSNFDYMISTHVSPGFSGSALISLDTGKIIGVVIEAVPAPRVGIIGSGIQKVTSLSCESSFLFKTNDRV